MFARPKQPSRLVAAAIVLALAGVGSLPTAFARLVMNTIDPVAGLSGHGRHLVVTGPIQCTAHEIAELQLTLTQRTQGALAEGRGRIVCTGAVQQWEVHASAQGEAAFEAGAATAVGLARTTGAARGASTDAHQWLVNVTLVWQ